MKRREPVFMTSHNAWYVEVDRRQIRLSTNEQHDPAGLLLRSMHRSSR